MKFISKLIPVLALSGAAVATQAAERPNVIIVFIDDFGYGDLGCYGSTKHRTPHIDQMAKEGIRLTDFYVGSSVSTPSRSALLTGCYPPVRIGGKRAPVNPRKLSVRITT